VFIPEEDVADDDEQVLYTYRNMNILLSIIWVHPRCVPLPRDDLVHKKAFRSALPVFDTVVELITLIYSELSIWIVRARQEFFWYTYTYNY
jgi:hypothetical protein